MLVVDEVQELALVPGGENIVASLRSALTRYRDYVRVIFTGSSEVALRELFTRSRAAMYEGASTLFFPRLGEPFLLFLRQRTRALFARKLDPQDCTLAFEAVRARPRAMIDLVLLHLSLDAKQSLLGLVGQQLEAYLLERDYSAQWQSLSPLEQAICRRIAAGDALTSHASLADYAKTIGRAIRRGPIAAGQVSKALTALQSKHIITRGEQRGSYQFDDPVFTEWLRRRPGSR